MRTAIQTVCALAGIGLAAGAQAQNCSPCEPLPIVAPSGAELKSIAIRLLQPTNAQRLEQLQSILRDRGLAFELQPVPNPNQKADPRAEGNNVLLTFGQGEQKIVVGAHFDAAQIPGGRLSGGMVDNAASVAVLVQLATALRDRPLRHKVQIAFFDLEELGLVGSRHFARSPQIDGTMAMINLDTLQGGETVIYGPAKHPGNDVIHGAMRHTCGVVSLSCLEFSQYPPSDDRSFQESGVPSVSLAVLPAVEAHQLWLMLNGGPQSGLPAGFVPDVLRTIHTAADQPDRLNTDTLVTAYRVALGLLRQVDRDLP